MHTVTLTRIVDKGTTSHLILHLFSLLCIAGKVCGPRHSDRLEYDEINEASSIQVSHSGRMVQRSDSFEDSQSEVAHIMPGSVRIFFFLFGCPPCSSGVDCHGAPFWSVWY